MPDAYGNLTNPGEFTTGRLIRFHSYLDSKDLVLAASSQMGVGLPNNPEAYVHHLSKGDARDQTVFKIIANAQWNGFFLSREYKMRPSGYPYLMAWGDTLHEMHGWPMGYAGPDQIFTVDMVDDGCWFALNNQDHTRVADVAGSGTAQGNPVIPYKWNGGYNQRWRAQIVS